MTQPLILIADADAASRAVLKSALDKAGYNVVALSDGDGVLAAAERQPPDLILLDVMMPGCDGLQACKQLRSLAATASIPVIFVSAQCGPEQVLSAFSAGGCDYIIKPFRVEEVLARVRVHVRLRQAEQDLLHRTRQIGEVAQRLGKANAELSRQAQVDALTSVLNRRGWEDSARREHERSVEQGRSYAILMLDLDHFKLLNDSQGHLAGDQCLQRVAEFIKSCCQPTTLVGRYGGEEFIVGMPDASPDSARELAERLRGGIADLGVRHPRHPHSDHVTVSVGVSLSSGCDFERAVREADHALYQAKAMGRNRVCAFLPCAAADPPKPPDEPAANEASPSPADSAADVLVVDDDPSNRALVRGLLSRKGYRVRECGEAQSAFQAIREQPPDVILMDVMMPGMSGLECVRHLKANRDTQGIPVIMISACADASDIEIGLESGADEYLAKPFNARELEARVRSMARVGKKHTSLLRAAEAEAHRKMLEAEIASSRQVEMALRQAKENADAANRAKSEFLAVMSHELRTPLNGVIGATDLLLHTRLDGPQRRHVMIAKHSADALLCLVNDVLDFSKIEAGAIELEDIPFNLVDTFECLRTSFAQRAESKGLRLAVVTHPQTPPTVRGDPGRLQQILMNLLSNAIKFTHTGEIAVRATIDSHSQDAITVRFTVNDTGIGIPADRLSRLFKPFSQVDSSTSRKYGGTGLGLAICKKLVEAMDGQIGAISEVGRGSTFWVTLPFRKAGQDAGPPRTSLDDLRQVLVLAVDDDPTAAVIDRELQAAGLSVEMACDAEQTREKLRAAVRLNRPFGLALIKLGAPAVDGMQLARAIKSDPVISDTILVLVTADEWPAHEETLREAGLSGFIRSPITGAGLVGSIAEAIACANRRPPELESASAPAPSPRVDRRAPARILVAEDNEIGKEVIAAMLAAGGFVCKVVDNGEEALNELRRAEYDLVLMDCQMPVMDGFEATRRIRQDERHAGEAGHARRLPIIALTANAFKEDMERCLAAGMDGYLSKPIVAERLIGAIESHLTKASLRPALDIAIPPPRDAGPLPRCDVSELPAV